MCDLRGQIFEFEVTTIGVVGRAGSFSRNHGRAKRMFRGALFPEAGAIMRLFNPSQDEAADAIRRLLRVDLLHIKDSFRVVIPEFVAEFVAALGN